MTVSLWRGTLFVWTYLCYTSVHTEGETQRFSLILRAAMFEKSSTLVAKLKPLNAMLRVA
jgi:hypothetical protein